MKKILICSGKGGVGKTTIASKIAQKLSDEYSVGLVDCDIDEPNVNIFLDIVQDIGIGEKIKPIIRNRLEIISLGFMIKSEDFVLWSGEKRAMAVQQLIQTVDWSNNLDYMVLDSPPGTSDEVEYIAGYFNPEMVYVVCTPEPMSISDAKRIIGMLNNFKSHIKGIIVNNISTNIKCPNCGEIINQRDMPNDILGIPVIATIEYTSDTKSININTVINNIKGV